MTQQVETLSLKTQCKYVTTLQQITHNLQSAALSTTSHCFSLFVGFSHLPRFCVFWSLFPHTIAVPVILSHAERRALAHTYDFSLFNTHRHTQQSQSSSPRSVSKEIYPSVPGQNDVVFHSVWKCRSGSESESLSLTPSVNERELSYAHIFCLSVHLSSTLTQIFKQSFKKMLPDRFPVDPCDDAYRPMGGLCSRVPEGRGCG